MTPSVGSDLEAVGATETQSFAETSTSNIDSCLANPDGKMTSETALTQELARDILQEMELDSPRATTCEQTVCG
jgi:hypothetical protein